MPRRECNVYPEDVDMPCPRVDRFTDGASVEDDWQDCLELSGLNGRVPKLGLGISTTATPASQRRVSKYAEIRAESGCEVVAATISRSCGKGAWIQRLVLDNGAEKIVPVAHNLNGIGENPSAARLSGT
jgi:hypothetical protein